MTIINTKNRTRYTSFILAIVFFISCFTNVYPGLTAFADDPVRIENFSFTFESGALLSEGQYIWNPEEDVSGHQFVYRVSFESIGDGFIEPGDLKLSIPKHILKARNGYYADLCELPMMEISQSTGGNEYAYYTSEDNIIITNVTRMSATGGGVIDVAYTTTRTTYSYPDSSISDSPSAVLTLSNNNVIIDSLAKTAPAVTVDTSAELLETTKKSSSERYASWDNTWGTRPEDADEYYYIIWTIVSKLTATQPYWFEIDDDFNEPDSDIVGYKLSGKTFFSNTNRAYYNNLPDTNRYDYVLTRHLKSSYTAEQYAQRNTCTVKLTPADEPEKSTSFGAAALFNYDKPEFVIPTHGFNAWKYGNTTWKEGFDYDWDIADYELTEFFTGERETLSGDVKYCLDMVANPYYDTLPEDADPNDPTQYGQRKIYYTLTDDKTYFNDAITTHMEEITIPEGTEPLTSEDIEIDYILYKYTAKDAVLDTEKMEFQETSPIYADDELLNFEGKFGDSDEWVNIAWLKPRTGTYYADSNYIRSFTNSKIVFQDNCTAYRITTANVHYKTSLVVYPYYKIKRSVSILDKISSSHYKDEMAWLTNTGSFEVVNDSGKVLYYKDVIGRDYFIGYVVNSSLAKKVTTFENNNADKYATIGWKVDFSESYISNDGRHYVKQDSGTFYDLIPQGSEVNLSTVALQTETGYLDQSEYDVSTITNYKNSGRTMLVVKLKDQFEYASLTYSLIYTWESVVDYGGLVLNSIAYETGNELVTDGFLDNGGTITEGDLLNDIDPDTNDAKFLYAEAGYTVSILIAANSGLTKTVKNGYDYMYGDASLVHQNGEYTYKIRYNTTGGVTTDNMILFDSLENFSNEEVSSVWWGILQGVDVTQPKQLGADPVVYYSNERLDINQHHDLTEESDGIRIWKTEEEFGNIENAKSIAVDLRKAGNGNNFVISDKDSIVVLLYMKAPPGDDSGTDDPKTYNGVYASYRTTDDINYSQQVFNEHGYSSVTLRIMADVNIRKVSTADNTTPVKGISFRLSGTSDYGTKVDQTLLTDLNGLLSFGNIEKGTYTLTEVSGSDEYLPIDTPIIVVIDENGNVSYNGVQVMEGVYYTIGNVPRLHADISFFKRDIAVPDLFITGARFELTGTSSYGNDVTLYAQSDSVGTVTFPNIELGTYIMRETNTDSEHILSDNVYIVTVSGKDMYSITVSNTEGEKDSSLIGTGISGAYSIYNEPYHSFVIQKEAYSDSLPIAGAVFELKGETSRGTFVDIVRTTNARGQISYTQMEAGIYTLQETFAPYGFGLDNTIRTVTIDKHGNVTISDSEKNTSGSFVITNKENGSITITKQWFDGLTNEERETNNVDAVIHLTTKKAEESAAYFADSTTANHSVLLSKKVADPITKVKSFRPWAGDDDTVRELIDNETAVKVDNGRTEYSIYAWLSNDGTVYWWSDAKNVYITNGSRLLRNLSDSTVIDVTGLDTSKMTNMTYMFGGDKAVKTLNLQGFDTSNVTDMSHMFRDCNNLVSVDLRRFDTSLTTTMASMFRDCSSLINVDLSSFDTSMVRNMSEMFYGCSKMTSLDVKGFDTSVVENMSSMFYNCPSLPEIDLSNFDTSTVTTMQQMFEYCRGLTSLDLSNFDTSSVTNMYQMFAYCSGLRSLDLNGFDTSSVNTMEQMFRDCTALTALDVSGFDTSSVTTMYFMFYNCNKLPSLDLSSFDTSSVTTMQQMFQACSSLTSLDVSSFDTSSVTTMQQMFQGCKNLPSLDLNSFDTSSVMYMSNMFNGCSGLSSLDVSGFDTSSVTTMTNMFVSCSGLKSITFSNKFKTSSVTAMDSMFSGCSSLESLDLSSFDTAVVTTMASMFSGCSSLTSIDLSSFRTPLVTNMSSMFSGCYRLTNLDLSTFDTSSVLYMNSMFSGCSNETTMTGLTSITFGSSFNTSNVINMSAMFSNCRFLAGLDLSGFNTSSVTDMSSMFSGCYTLETLDLSSFNTSHVTTMASMFSGCFKAAAGTGIKSITIGADFDTSRVTTMASMFSGCQYLTSVDVSRFNTSRVTDMSSMFGNCYVLTPIDVSGFRTGCVITMSSMFSGCRAASVIDVSGFDTTNVTTMSSMFNSCVSVTELNVSDFKTGKVNSMSSMFSGCSGVTALDVSGFVTKNVTTMNSMFYGCTNVQTLNVSGFDTSLVMDMSGMFRGCNALTAVDVSHFSTSLVTTMSYMFENCYLLPEIVVSGFDTTGVTSYTNMFINCRGLTELDLSSFDTAAAIYINSMFQGCSNLVTIYVSEAWNMEFASNHSNMFNGCTSISGQTGQTYDNSKINKVYAHIDSSDNPGYLTYKANASVWVNDGACFRPCLAADSSFLSKILAVGSIKVFEHYNGTNAQAQTIIEGGTAVRVDDLSTEHYIYAWNSNGTIYWWSDTDKVYLDGGSSSIFCGLTNCTKIDLSGIDTSHMTTMNNMFKNCQKLTSLTFGSSFDTSSVRTMQSMFQNCYALTSVDISGFDVSKVLTMESMFNKCSKLTKITLGSNFHAKAVKRMKTMFADCTVLSTMDTSGFYARDVCDMNQMFVNCKALTSINLSNFASSEIIDLRSAFQECNKVSSIIFSGSFNTSKAVDMYQMFYNCNSLSGTLDLSSFDASSCTTMYRMFYNCKMKNIDFGSNFKASMCTNMNNMFQSCTNLEDLDLSSFSPSHCITMEGMFYECNALTDISFASNYDTSEVISMASMFYNCKKLTALDVSMFSTANVINMSSMFSNCLLIATLNVTGFNTSNVTTMASMFYNCQKVASLALTSFDTSKVTTMASMFYRCHVVTSISFDKTKFNTSNVKSMSQMFQECKALPTLDVSGFDTSKVTTMYYMFNSCSVLTSLGVSGFCTDNVTDMQYMFSGCSRLANIDVSGFNTGKVTNMQYMFNGCSQLTALDVHGFDTHEVTNMTYMFNGCSKLESIDVSGFDTHEVTNMSYMFNNCQKITSLGLSSFDTHEVTNMSGMFSGCLEIASLDLSGFDTHEVTSMYQMFYNCKNALTSITFGEHFDTSEVYNMESMFNSCNKLTSLDLSSFDTSEVYNMASMFSSCQSLQSVTLSESFRTGEVVYMGGMFNSCYELEALDLSSFDTSNVTTMNLMFANCRALTSLDISNFSTPKVYSMSSMFSGCYLLEELNVSGFDTRRVNTMDSMFNECRVLKSLDLSSFVTPKVTSMSGMFNNCYELESVNVGNFDTNRVTSMYSMFYNCQKLKSLDLSSFETPRLTSMQQMFCNCYELESIDLSNFNTTGITDMSSLFSSCRKLTALDLRNFNTYNVTSMANMFSSCDALTYVDLTNFYTANVKNMDSMFYTCSSITELDLSSFDTSAVTNMRSMFNNCPELTTIYVSNYWADKTGEDWITYRMFYSDKKLVGENGTMLTVNNDNNTNWRFNYVDTAETPGYLTYKAASVNNSTDLVSTESYCNIVKLTDSVWVYTFNGLNPNVQYYAWEEELDEYIESNLQDNLLTVENLKGTITNRLPQYPDDEPEYGTLSIRKVLRAESGAELTDADFDRTFIFTISFKDENGEALSGTSLYGGLVFTDGKANVRIPANVTMTLDYIPSGYLYTVTEEDTQQFMESGWNTNGTIETNLTSRVVYTNTKFAVEEQFNSFTVKKAVTGIYEIDADYHFTASLTGLHAEEEYTLSDGSKFTSDTNGSAVIDFYLKNNEEITISDMPVGASYKVTEAAGDYISSYFITDSQDTGNIARVTDANTQTGRSLSTAAEYVENNEDITITFTNSKDARQDVVLRKILANASETNVDVFTFTAQISGLAPNETIRTGLGVRSADENGDLSMVFEMSDNDEMIFYKLPVGSTYRFTESGNEWVASYDISNSGTGGSIVSASASNDINYTSLSTETETVNENEIVTVTFTNTKIQRDLTITKMVDAAGSGLSYAEYSMQNFKFIIRFTGLEEDETYQMQYTRQNFSGIADTGSFTADSSGNAEVTLFLNHGRAVRIKDLPEGAKYTVTESPTINYISAYRIYGNEDAVIARENDSNRKTCRILSTAEETVDEPEVDVEIIFTNRYYDDPTARICLVTIEKEIDTKIEAFGTPTFLFKLTNTDTGDEFMCNITLSGNKLKGTQTVSVTKGHYIVEEIPVGRYSCVSAEFLADTTASSLMIDNEYTDVGIPKLQGKVFSFSLDMTNGEPDTAYLKYTNKLTNYSGVSHNDFILNNIS